MSHRIVFRDKKGVLKGPYSERTIQEWYRSGWFDRSFEFSFLSESEQFSDRTPVYSLGQLIDSNGSGCPFLGPPLKNRCEEQEEKLSRLEKEIVEVRSAIDSAPALKRRLEAIEKRIETLAKPRPSSNPTTKVTVTGPSQRVREECEKLASLLVICANEALDRLQTGKKGRWNEEQGDEIIRGANVFEAVHANDDAVMRLMSDIVLQKLQKSLEGREFIYCSLCETLALNPRQALLHHVTDRHADAVNEQWVRSGLSVGANPQIVFLLGLAKLAPIVVIWREEANKLFLSQRAAINKSVRPDQTFFLELQFAHAAPITLKVGTELGGVDPSLLDFASPALTSFKGKLGAAIIAKLNAHIGENKTGCASCGVVTGSRQAYYEHVLGWAHMEFIAKGRHLDVITFAVNCHLKHLGKTTLI